MPETTYLDTVEALRSNVEAARARRPMRRREPSHASRLRHTCDPDGRDLALDDDEEDRYEREDPWT